MKSGKTLVDSIEIISTLIEAMKSLNEAKSIMLLTALLIRLDRKIADEIIGKESRIDLSRIDSSKVFQLVKALFLKINYDNKADEIINLFDKVIFYKRKSPNTVLKKNELERIKKVYEKYVTQKDIQTIPQLKIPLNTDALDNKTCFSPIYLQIYQILLKKLREIILQHQKKILKTQK